MEAPIYFDARWAGRHGIGRFASELLQRLPAVVALDIAGRKLSLIDPISISVALAKKKSGCFLSPGFNPPLRSPIPIIFTIHDLIHLKVPSESSAFRRLYYETVVRPAARRARCILTVSDHSRQDIVEWARVPHEKVKVVGNGVSEVFAPYGAVFRPGYGYLLHVGRRASHKNVSGLLAAFAQSRASEGLRLVFTGNADDQTCRDAQRLGLFRKVDFAGDLADDELAALYRGAAAMVFPSFYEGFGIPIVEAMACGTPVITSGLTAMAEVSGPGNTLLIDPRDVGALSAAIDRLVYDPVLRQTLASRGLARARDFTWDKVAARVLCALELPSSACSPHSERPRPQSCSANRRPM